MRRYLFTTDHKIVGLQYFWLSLIAVVIGVVLSLLMRFHLVYPDAKVGFFERLWPTGAAGGVMTPELYLSLMTMHGTIMVFFVLSVTPQSAFGHYFLPIQVGARNMAFPMLGPLSFWLTAIAFCVMLAAFFVPGGAPCPVGLLIHRLAQSGPSRVLGKGPDRRCGLSASRYSAWRRRWAR